jgi:hypothetical protein
MHRISGRPDIQQDNPAFFISGIRPDTRLPAGYPLRPDTGYPAGYPANVFLQIRLEKKLA